MTFSLFCLGTDTEYQKALNKPDDYPLGETLSVAATMIKAENPREPSEIKSEAIRISSDNVCLIDGPTTLGTEVHERIKDGLMALLEASSKDKTNLQIIAHSRGACQSLIIAHHLDAIQNELHKFKNSEDLKQFVKTQLHSDVNFTANDELFFQKLDLQKFKANLQRVSVEMFLLDPVPGGSFLGLRKLKWDDKRFYKVPKIVKKYKQILYGNERSRGFKPVIALSEHEEQSYSVDTLPGHHGTGSGNPYDQAKYFRSKPDYDITKTQGVQKLIFAKLIHFLRVSGHTIERPAAPGVLPPHTDVLCQLADEVNQHSIDEIQLQLYEDILKNLQAYQAFNKTSYPWLTKEQSIQSCFIPYVDDRIIHFGSKADSFLSRVLPSERGDLYLNFEHMMLDIHAKTQTQFNCENPLECLRELKNHLPKDKDLSPENETFDLMLIDKVIKNLCQAFIDDQIDLTPKDKLEAVTILNEILKDLKCYYDRHAVTESVADILVSPREGINVALSTKLETIKQDSSQLLTEGLGNARAMDLVVQLKTNLKYFGDDIQPLIFELESKGVINSEHLNIVKRNYQSKPQNDEDEIDYSSIFDELEKWTHQGIKKQQLQIFSILCDRYHSCINIRAYSEALQDNIDAESITALDELIENVKFKLIYYLSNATFNLFDIEKHADEETKKIVKDIMPGEVLANFIDKQFYFWDKHLQQREKYLTDLDSNILKIREVLADGTKLSWEERLKCPFPPLEEFQSCRQFLHKFVEEPQKLGGLIKKYNPSVSQQIQPKCKQHQKQIESLIEITEEKARVMDELREAFLIQIHDTIDLSLNTQEIKLHKLERSFSPLIDMNNVSESLNGKEEKIRHILNELRYLQLSFNQISEDTKQAKMTKFARRLKHDLTRTRQKFEQLLNELAVIEKIRPIIEQQSISPMPQAPTILLASNANTEQLNEYVQYLENLSTHVYELMSIVKKLQKYEASNLVIQIISQYNKQIISVNERIEYVRRDIASHPRRADSDCQLIQSHSVLIRPPGSNNDIPLQGGLNDSAGINSHQDGEAPAPSDPNPNGSNVAQDQPCNLCAILVDAAKLILWAALLGGAIYLACTSSLIVGIIGAGVMLGVGLYSCASNEQPQVGI